jgi:hypothetical protein
MPFNLSFESILTTFKLVLNSYKKRLDVSVSFLL